MVSLDGRVAVVTGASQGIGAAVAARLAEEGAAVVLIARSREKLEEVAASIGSAAVPLCCDVGNADTVRAAFGEIRELFGRVDVLVNNAGLIAMAYLEDAPDESVTSQIASNLTGPILCSRAAIPLLRASGGGDIINISSRSVELARPALSVYSATKGGLETFGRTLAAELRPVGIRVSSIRVGPVASHPNVAVAPDAGDVVRDWVARGGPAPEPPAPPESVADAVVFIATARPGCRYPVIHLEPA